MQQKDLNVKIIADWIWRKDPQSGYNDIIIADYVISKYHAEIVLFRDMYFIVDADSTNGTKVNGRQVTSQMKIQLQYNSIISFGRYGFVFAPPLQIYRAIRREIIET